MTPEQQTIITRLETRVRQLILQYAKLREEKGTLEQKLAEAMQREEALKAENAHLQNLYDNLKMARILELNDTDERNAKGRLAKLVREVDNCIAMLKAK